MSDGLPGMSEGLVQIGGPTAHAPRAAHTPRPEWLRIRLATPGQYHQVKKLVGELNLHTVCQEARCPNIYECWGEHGTATFMILGEICTRRCGFCAVTSGRPRRLLDGPRDLITLARYSGWIAVYSAEARGGLALVGLMMVATGVIWSRRLSPNDRDPLLT